MEDEIDYSTIPGTATAITGADGPTVTEFTQAIAAREDRTHVGDLIQFVQAQTQAAIDRPITEEFRTLVGTTREVTAQLNTLQSTCSPFEELRNSKDPSSYRIDNSRLQPLLSSLNKAHSEMDYKACYDLVPALFEVFPDFSRVTAVPRREDGKLPFYVPIDMVQEMVQKSLIALEVLTDGMQALSKVMRKEETVDASFDPLAYALDILSDARYKIRWIGSREIRDLNLTGEVDAPYIPNLEHVDEEFSDPEEDTSGLTEMERLELEIAQIHNGVHEGLSAVEVPPPLGAVAGRAMGVGVATAGPTWVRTPDRPADTGLIWRNPAAEVTLGNHDETPF